MPFGVKFMGPKDELIKYRTMSAVPRVGEAARLKSEVWRVEDVIWSPSPMSDGEVEVVLRPAGG